MSESSALTVSVVAKLKRIGTAFIAILGIAWLLVNPARSLLPPRYAPSGGSVYVAMLVVAVVGALWKARPLKTITNRVAGSDVTIQVKLGDLLTEDGNLVVGTNDVFDTELGEVVSPRSVQGQFQTRMYSGDTLRLDADLAAALRTLDAQKRHDPAKTRGKPWRYPIGTIATLGGPERRYFLPAYARMGTDLKCHAEVDDLVVTLRALWNEVRTKGQGAPVSIPVIGSELARTGLPRMALIKIIAMSYIVASRHQFVSKRLSIIVHMSDQEHIDMWDLADFLRSACA